VRYKVRLQRYVEETTVVEIEAEDAASAAEAGEIYVRKHWRQIKWDEGDDIMHQCAYEVSDMDNNTLWDLGGSHDYEE
jgi:hypothetical protein